MKVLIFVDHDIVYRHFIRSGAFRDLATHHEVKLVLAADQKRVSVTGDDAGLTVTSIPPDRARLTKWRRLFQIEQLRWRPGPARRNARATTRYTIGGRAAAYYTLLGLPGIFPVVRKLALRELENNGYCALQELLTKERPEVVIHPTVLEGIFANDLVAICRRNSIPLVFIMNSWDNPSTKRAVIGAPDYLLVWGPQTQRHAQQFMGMDPRRAIPFGVAQFEIYRQPPRQDRKAFLASHGISPDRTVVLYAGSSKGTDEFGHLMLLDQAIKDGSLPNVAILYRPHPWGGGGRKGERFVGHEFENVRIESSMRDYLNALGRPARDFLADYQDTHNALSAVDAVISPMSTILIEAALHGKAIACLLDDLDGNEVLRVRQMQAQFSELFQEPAVGECRGATDLVACIEWLAAAAHNPNNRRALRTMCNDIVSTFEEPFGRRLTEFVDDRIGAARESNCGPASTRSMASAT